MTITVHGHISKMETSLNPRMQVRLTITTESARGGEPMIVEVSAAELGGLYLPGTAVQIMVVPIKVTT